MLICSAKDDVKQAGMTCIIVMNFTRTKKEILKTFG